MQGFELKLEHVTIKGAIYISLFNKCVGAWKGKGRPFLSYVLLSERGVAQWVARLTRNRSITQ